jgi:hypothetical protein
MLRIGARAHPMPAIHFRYSLLMLPRVLVDDAHGRRKVCTVIDVAGGDGVALQTVSMVRDERVKKRLGLDKRAPAAHGARGGTKEPADVADGVEVRAQGFIECTLYFAL